jgi:nitric oxide synthase oxygenase domain/subunit
MHPIFEKISLPFVYGPLTQEEVNSITVSKALVPEPDGWYVGTAVEVSNLADKKIFKWVPPVIEEEAPPAE